MNSLNGKTALVTGGTRNVGKGIVKSLVNAGAKVYVTGRSITVKDIPKPNLNGGLAIPVVCNHENDFEVECVFNLISEEEKKLDILVNNAWGGYKRLRNRSEYKGFKWKEVFWKQPIKLWDEMTIVGVRSNYIASVFGARIMTKNKSGLIVNISFYAGKKYYRNVIYGTAKAAVDKMTMDMAVELKPYNVSCVSLYPGYIDDKKRIANPKKETSQFVGMGIAALALDENVISKSGSILIAAELGKEYGFKEIDGSQPIPFDTLD